MKLERFAIKCRGWFLVKSRTIHLELDGHEGSTGIQRWREAWKVRRADLISNTLVFLVQQGSCAILHGLRNRIFCFSAMTQIEMVCRRSSSMLRAGRGRVRCMEMVTLEQGREGTRENAPIAKFIWSWITRSGDDNGLWSQTRNVTALARRYLLTHQFVDLESEGVEHLSSIAAFLVRERQRLQISTERSLPMT